MFPDLLSATQDYWRQLSAVEKAYQNDELTLEQVNTEVEKLMKELGEQRREAFRFFWEQFPYALGQFKDLLLILAFLFLITYIWVWIYLGNVH